MKLPKWAVFVARDEIGTLHVFEAEPKKGKLFPEWLPGSLAHRSLLIKDTDNIFKEVIWSDARATNIKEFADYLLKEAESLRDMSDALIRNWEQENGIPENVSVAEYNQWQITQARAHGYYEPPVMDAKPIVYKNKFTGDRMGFDAALSESEMTFLDLVEDYDAAE